MTTASKKGLEFELEIEKSKRKSDADIHLKAHADKTFRSYGERQSIFDTVCLGLASQGGPSHIWNPVSLKGRRCFMRHPQLPLKDPIGMLLSDDEYDDKMEAETLTFLVDSNWLPSRLHFHESFLLALQVAHDYSDTKEQLKKKLIEIADSEKLSHVKVDLIQSWEIGSPSE